MKPRRYFKRMTNYKRKRHFCVSGIYFLLKDRKIVYIGQSGWVLSRILFGHSHGKTKKDWNEFRIIPCHENVRRKYETRWLNKFKPMYNKQIPKLVQSESFIERQEFLKWLRTEYQAA